MNGGQKTLPPKYFYDDVGSALFEAITRLPEYGLTRADERVLNRCAPELAGELRGDTLVLELGCGSGRKTGRILEAFTKNNHRKTRYMPVDISGDALEACARELGRFCEVTPILGEFLDGARAAALARQQGERVLVLFLGSTVGNFAQDEADSLLTAIRGSLEMGDAMLVGADLVKPVERLIAAYDDAAGVTAAFNLNLLARMNRELAAQFDTRQFRHMAAYDNSYKRIEMHLESLRDQEVRIPRSHCTVRFRRGETIWTESSHKYTLADTRRMAEGNGYSVLDEWTDAAWPFVESLWTVD